MIYEELKGRGNMEVELDGKVSEGGMFGAIEIGGSCRRKEEVLIRKGELDRLWEVGNVFRDSMDFRERFIGKLKG
ncbi:hypothetical protein [Staphylococcus warneri]|uniref:hypothetical protein n=1 Tax=Staphylococcus warneri TaxID=1292 RepID=UPI0011A44B7A